MSPAREWVTAMAYSGPDGSKILNPTPADLKAIIFDKHHDYWQTGSGDSGLAVGQHRGKREESPIDGEPALMFYLVEPHGFFFLFFQPTAKFVVQFVTFTGGESRPWVEHCVGGYSFYAPLACFVSRPLAWEVVSEFLQSKSRSVAVSWVKRSTLKFPSPDAGDEAPSHEDLA